jgi:hypothetical protein
MTASRCLGAALAKLWKRLVEGLSSTDSSMEFHASQLEHWPCHLADIPPQDWQT